MFVSTVGSPCRKAQTISCLYFEFPKNLQEAEAFIHEMRKLK